MYLLIPFEGVTLHSSHLKWCNYFDRQVKSVPNFLRSRLGRSRSLMVHVKIARWWDWTTILLFSSLCDPGVCVFNHSIISISTDFRTLWNFQPLYGNERIWWSLWQLHPPLIKHIQVSVKTSRDHKHSLLCRCIKSIERSFTRVQTHVRSMLHACRAVLSVLSLTETLHPLVLSVFF